MEMAEKMMEAAWWIVAVTLGAWFVYLTVGCLLKVKEKRWKRILLFGGCHITLMMIIYIGDLYNLPPALAILTGCIFLACEGTALKKTVIALLIASTVFAFNGWYDNGLVFLWDERGYVLKNRCLFAAERLVFAFLMYLTVRSFHIDRELELAASYLRLLLCLCLAPLGIIVSLILFRSPFYTSRDNTMLADEVLFLIAGFSFIGLLWAIKVLGRQQELEREHLCARYNQKYYEELEQQQFEIRRLRHDLSNHLQTLLTLPEEKKNGYIREMLASSGVARTVRYSEDVTVNAVLSAKAALMEQKNICFCHQITIGQELCFAKPDICSLLANALDNAAEGCLRLDRQERRVWLTVKADKGILAAEVKNTCEKSMAAEKGKSMRLSHLPDTTKKDGKHHGLGLRSIQSIVKKYGGSMEIRREVWQQEGTELFILFFYLPAPETETC